MIISVPYHLCELVMLSSCLQGQHQQPPGAFLAYVAYGIQNGRGNFFFLRLNSIPVCIYHILCTRSFVDSLLGCFHHLTLRSNAWALLLLSASSKASSMIKRQLTSAVEDEEKTKPIAGEDAKWYNHFRKQFGNS